MDGGQWPVDDEWSDPTKPVVFGTPAGFLLHLSFDVEVRLLAGLIQRAHNRARAEQQTSTAGHNSGDLLAARAHAINAGHVPIQNIKHRLSTEDLLERLRQKHRTQ